jgi:SAM-dependent methyltransferase
MSRPRERSIAFSESSRFSLRLDLGRWSQTRVAMRSSRSAVEYGIIVCERCKSSDWFLEDDKMLRCGFCGVGVIIENNIIDSLSSSGPASPVVKEWGAFYSGGIKPYVADADWWTLSNWEKHLFGGLLQDLPSKFIVDFGCGTASRVASIAPIQTYRYRYLGVDSSLEALKYAARVLPGGLFIRADLASLELRPESADIVLCLGVLMYFDDYIEPLTRLVNSMKPGGIMLLHEAISRKSWGHLLGVDRGHQHNHYPEPRCVRVRQLFDFLSHRGSIIHKHLAGSPLRTAFIRFFDATHLEPLRPLAAALDSIWCATVGRVLPALGAAEVQLVFRKAQEQAR